MNITKQQLKEIIKEELESALNEFGGAGLNSLIKEVADNGLKKWGGGKQEKIFLLVLRKTK